MAFKKVAGARTYFKYKECEPDQQLVTSGVYAGAENGKFGIQHIFKQLDGKIICLNSSGHLDWLLENHANPGDLCNVYYKEKIVLEKGTFKGKEAHNFELEVDDEYGKSRPAPKAATAKVIEPEDVPYDGKDISL